MQQILRIISANLTKGPATVRLPESVPSPPGYRGQVVLDSTHCLACGICAYVCVSDAITGADEGSGYAWTYEPGRCTFCARCLDHCPGRALSMSPEPLPPYVRLGELGVRRLVAFPVCPDCGVPVRPATDELISRAFDHIKEDTRSLVRLCERCRRRRLQRSLFIAAAEDQVRKPDER